MKRFIGKLSVICITLLLTVCLSVTVLAAQPAAQGSAGQDITWTMDSSGTLTLSGTGAVTEAPWQKEYRTVIQRVVVADGITAIPANAFAGCSSLREVALPPSVTVLGSGCLADCHLDSLQLHPTVTVTADSLWGCYTKALYISDLSHFLKLHETAPRLTLVFGELYLNDSLVTELVIPDGTAAIPANTFDSCTSINAVILPDSVTSIGTYAFYGCSSLRTIKLSEGLSTISECAFYNCSALTRVIFPASLRSIGRQAFYCNPWEKLSALETIRFMGSAPLMAADAFRDVTATVSYSAENPTWTDTLRQGYGGSLTWTADPSIPNTAPSIPSPITGAGTCGSAAAWALDSKGTLTVSGTGPVTEAPWQEEYRTVIQAAVVQEGITAIPANAFAGCTDLKTLHLPQSLTAIGSGCFMGCSLDSLTLPCTVNAGTDTVWGGYTKELVISDLAQFLKLSAAAPNNDLTFTSLSLSGSPITELVIPEGTAAIPANAFDGCSTITSVTLPDSVTAIGDRAFYGCSGIETITLPAQLRSIGRQAFYCYPWDGASALSTVRFTGSAPLIAPDAFRDVTATVYYSQDNPTWTDAVRQGYGGSLTWTADPSIPNTAAPEQSELVARGDCGSNAAWTLDTKGVLTLSGMGQVSSAPWQSEYRFLIQKAVVEDGISALCSDAFAECTNLKEVLLPESLRVLGSGCFQHCELDALHLPASLSTDTSDWLGGSAEKLYVTDLDRFLKNITNTTLNGFSLTFSQLYVNDTLVTELRFPDGTTAIPTRSFMGCSSITSVILPDSVTAIGAYAFYGCRNLESVQLSKGLATVADAAFAVCGGGKPITLRFAGNAPLMASDAFQGTTAKAHYPVKNTTWTEGKLLGYGGKLSWIPTASANPFTDVSGTDWYFAPVLWAYENGVTGGTSATTFGPNDGCTRAQVVTFLWAANGKPEPKTTENPFTDVAGDAWYLKPVLWAVEQGITTGVSPTRFGPDQTCTRAQIVTFLYAAEHKPDVSGESSFTDVAENAWYLKPVLWAAQNEVTGGIAEGLFGPDNTCTRGQVVTFLYKVYGN